MNHLAIANQIARCIRKDLHPTHHAPGCRCEHCWEEEMGHRIVLGARVWTREVWQRGKNVLPQVR